MKSTKIISLIVLTIILLSMNAYSTNLPNSRQASLVESSSPTEVMIRATGIGEPFKKKKVNEMLNSAIIDAKKSAVYFILFGGTDPLLQTEEERKKFEPIKEEFFSIDNINRYIVWEANQNISQVKIKDGKKYKMKIERSVKVNKKMITDDLVAKGIIIAREDLAESIGLPFIMVIPEVKEGESPVEKLKTDQRAKQAAAVIEGYLTTRKYDVVVPEQQEALNKLADAQAFAGDREEDISYQLALSIGSDVYITYSITIDKASYGTKKASLICKAFETTTARLLGTETGYSPARPSPENVLIEEAMNDAIDKVLSRVMAYWKDDMKRGVQYKIIVSISTDFDEDQVLDIQRAIRKAIKSVSKSSKKNIATKQTIDYLIWVNPQEYEESLDIFDEMELVFDKRGVEGKLRLLNENRKMIMLKVDTD